ncbi:pentapeptide repeat-containing protein [Streptomyces sp. NPDC127190]|uniref:pentapeptide repeat-containing protein n=1 Tax=unclassified Streptomyces TaxID=2593676 RepID=UPI003627988A
MPASGPWQWLLVGTLLVLGMLFAADAWRLAVHQTEKGSKIGVLSAIGGGLITGLSVGLATLMLQASFDASTRYATWRADVEAAESIPGFSPGNRDIRGINFSGKSLFDADFTNADLRGSQLRDTKLYGALFDRAHMGGANLVGADMEASSFDHTDLRGALLQSANLTHAKMVETPQELAGAQVNARTCWPKGISLQMLKEVKVRNFTNKEGVVITAQQDKREDGIAGGEVAPHCHLMER